MKYGSFPEAEADLRVRGRYTYEEDGFSMSISKTSRGTYAVESSYVHGKEGDGGEPIVSDEVSEEFDNMEDATQAMHNQYNDFSVAYDRNW